MTRFFRLPSFAAITVALTTFITAGPADARIPVRSVKAAVTVRNAVPGWSLNVRLAPRTRLTSVSGGAASARRGAIVVKPKWATLTLVTRGAGRPKGWSIGAAPCTVKAAGRSGATLRMNVTCVVPAQHATGALPAPAATPAAGGDTTPAAGTTPGGDNTPGGDSTPGGDGAPGGDTTPGADATPTPTPTPTPTATPTPTPTATPTPTPTPTATPEPAAPYRFAPYVDFAGWPMPNLATTRTATGVDHISLGFVVQSTSGGCVPRWGGLDAYPAAGTDARGRTEVQAFRQGGGDVVPSFGGAAGTELATVCTTVNQLTAAYQSVIDTYGATHVDFDIEGSAVGNTTANTRRAQAIALLQLANPGLVVTYTLPTDPTGLDAGGLALVQNAIANGVDIAAVNIMAMDYWGVANPAGNMGAYAIQAATSLYNQLTTLRPGLTAAQRWRMIGVTPMLGINDVSDQIFGLNDARQLVAWASAHQIGMLGMWALERDNQCDAPVTTAQLKCSGVTQDDYAFATILRTF